MKHPLIIISVLVPDHHLMHFVCDVIRITGFAARKSQKIDGTSINKVFLCGDGVNTTLDENHITLPNKN